MVKISSGVTDGVGCEIWTPIDFSINPRIRMIGKVAQHTEMPVPRPNRPQLVSRSNTLLPRRPVVNKEWMRPVDYFPC